MPNVFFRKVYLGEKVFYVAYMAEPLFPQFSKFMIELKWRRGGGLVVACSTKVT